MSSEIEAMDCGDATESTGEDRQGAEPAPTAEKEKADAGSPSVAEIIPAEPTVLEEKGKPTIEDDVEMADPKSEEPTLMDAEDNPSQIVSDKSEVEVACGSPVEVGTKKAEDLAPVEIDSDSSVEVIDSPVKSPPSNKSGDERKKAADESPSNALAKKEKNEEGELADSSIELISSPTSEDSAGRDQPKEGKKQEEKKAGASTETSRDAEQEMKGSPKPTEPDDALEVKLEKKTVEVEQKMDVDQNNLTWDGDIFYGKDCVNCNCKRLHKQFVLANMATLNFYKVTRKVSKQQFVCTGCSDAAMEMYEQYAGYLMEKQPLLLKDFPQDQDDFVALDSSDEEEEDNKVEEKPELSTNDLKLVENELEDAIATVLNRVGFKDQLSWSKSILVAKAERLERHFELAEKEMEAVQSVADKMHWDLYTSCTVVHKHLPPLDLQHNIGEYMQVPPAGEIERPPIQIGETYYAVKNKAIASWVSIKVIEFSESTAIGGNTMKSYKIKYLNTPYQMVKTVTAKHIAYFEPPPVRLTIGTRVIAYFDGSTLSRGKDKGVVQSAFYPGIIAEPLKQANRFRYLIFYDDGYTQYVQHRDVRLVCQASEKVWEDVHPASRDFIQKYVEKYSVDRPMVQCTRGQSMNTESNGTWLYARVIDIDCSLVLMHFEAEKNHTEWIYRGSLRLGPVFKETQNALSNANAHHARVPRRTEPFIRYTKEMESSNMQVNQQMRAMARKSSSVAQGAVASAASSSPVNTPAASRSSAPNANRGPVKHLNNSTIYVDDENRPKGHVVYFTAKRNLPPKIYRPHECNSGCLFKIAHRLDSYSPLAKPLLSGWERLVLRQKTKKNVVYRGPCGKSLRSLGEVHYYLRKTENVLNVDNFDFTPDLKCLAEYSIDPTIVKEADISKGQEKMAIPLVNYYDNSLPPPCTYAKQRIPTEGVHLNLDEEFLVGCDCDDDCSDKSKCSCWQLTVAGVKYCNPKKPIEEIGYQYKRLHEHVPTGIYECNSRCKCKKNCLNRVVQHSLEMKLQVFKTSNRGWGLRCVNDIPKGAFICIYAGHLLTETMANEGGQDAGDEYFADLDYIEVAEQLKEGYESEVEQSEPEPEEDSYLPEAEDDDDFRPNKYYQKKNKVRATRSISASGQSTEVDSQERAVINFNPNADLDETVRENSVRRLFGKDEAPYIMDAKTTGNLGRYFNHSCNPNLFVQNVFVDTHDLRFPWVAFFSASHIRSGTELTWNYNYEVGVVPGKVLYCQCGATNCRIRLL